MSPNLKKLSFVIFFFIIMTFPYIIAFQTAGSSNIFGGFLLNPIDGNTYLAKMVQGYSGAWLFTLPYTYIEGEGIFLFGFYLFLGHLARWTGLSLILIFHAARITAVGLFLLSIYHFIRNIVPVNSHEDGNKSISHRSRLFEYSLLLCCFGSGLGWMATFAGAMTADLWVAEAYPFLSAFTSPHFTLGMALLLWLLSASGARTFYDNLKVWGIGILLAVVMPFGAIIGGLVITVNAVWQWFETKKLSIYPTVSLLAGAGVIVIIQYLQVRQDPLLANWNLQNITFSPPLWDLFISYSPALIFAFGGIYYLYREKRVKGYQLIIVWFFTSILLVLVPFSLQRRFMFAQYIPTALLAIPGILLFTKKHLNMVFIGLLSVSVMTNVLLIFSGVLAVQSGNPRMVIQSDERTALDWLKSNTDRNALVMCSPAFGNFIPAYSGNRVLYGHPFETVDAEEMESISSQFYNGQMNIDEQRAILTEYGVDWVFYGPRESQLGQPQILDTLPLVYQSGSVSIYEVTVYQ
jgi:hypothetical protein